MEAIASGARLKDRYRLDGLLGRGGMASVWLATDEVLDRPVAVKVLSDAIASDPEYVARFRREARVAASISHPNLAGIYDFAERSERPFLVMEHVAGGTLAERIEAGRQLDCVRIARELLGALEHIHAAGIVHRDVKPQNILFAEDGSTRLIDFGIALPPDATALTRTGNLLGTARFIAPEVMHGRPATARSDLYSCGVVLRDCVGESDGSPLAGLIGRLTADDPDARPASAGAAAALIDRERPRPERPTEPLHTEPTREWRAQPELVPEPRRRSGRALPVAVLAAIAALGLGAIALTSGSDEGGGESDRRVAAKERAGGGQENVEATAPGEEQTDVPEPAGEDSAAGSALNEEGYALIQEGRAEEAVPVLEEAVEAFPPGTEELDYAYALFNLGNALRLSGRPDEAIPVLERRLAIPNQTGVVQRELEAARAEASS